MSQKEIVNSKYASTPIFKQVVLYCLKIEVIMASLPFVFVLISIGLRALSLKSAAEFISVFVVFPLFAIVPLLVTIKQINTFKRSFPRASNDKHRVILSVFFCTALIIIINIILFITSCYLYSFYPLEFREAAYIRDMFASSIGAMVITFLAVFVAYLLISLMVTTAYFMGEAKRKKYSFTLSCIIFFIMYVILLIIFVIAYLTATFLDIKALENIQIANSIFNSSILCSFVTFIVISLAAMPILYKLNFRALQNQPLPTKIK